LLRVLAAAIIIVAILPLISVSSSVYGQEEQPRKVTHRFDGSLAYALWNGENEDGSLLFTYDLFVSYDKKARTTTVDLHRSTYTSDGSFVKSEYGIETFQDRVFTIDNKLTSATLSPVTLSMKGCDADVCFPTGETLTVQASWTGQGAITQNDFKSKTSGPLYEGVEYAAKSSTGTQSRGASALISVDGQESQSTEASLTQSKQIQVTRYYYS
jgi:hypothetical protein